MNKGDNHYFVNNPALFQQCFITTQRIYNSTWLRNFGKDCFEEVSLEVITAAYLRLNPRYNGSLSIVDDFDPYIYTALKNQCINYKKKMDKLRTEVFTEQNEPWHQPLSEFEIKVDQTLIDAIARLTPRRKEVIMLYYYEGLRLGDIANRLNISRDTVKEHKERALISIKRSMINANWQMIKK